MKKLQLLLIISMLSCTFQQANAQCVSDGGINTYALASGGNAQVRVNNDVISLGSGLFRYHVGNTNNILSNFFLVLGPSQTAWTEGSATTLTAGPHDLYFNLYNPGNSPVCSDQYVTIYFQRLTGSWIDVCNYTLHVVIGSNSRSNLTFAEGFGQLFYTGDDQLVYTEQWTGSTWTQSAITPTGGWGSVRVAGNLSVASDMSRVFFKGTDNKLYNLVNSSGTWTLSLVLSTLPVLDAKSNVCARGNGEVVVMSSTGSLIQLLLSGGVWTSNPITPSGGWGSVSAKASTFTLVPGTNNIFISTGSYIYNLSQSSGVWTLTQVYASGQQTPLADLVATENTSVYYRGYDNRVHCYNYISGVWVYDAMVASNDPNMEVTGFLTKFPGDERIFYKSRTGLVANIYKSGGVWYNYALDYYLTDAAGDVTVGEGKVFYISRNKTVNGFYYSAGWHGGPVVSSAPANAYGCSLPYYNYNFRLNEQENAVPADVPAAALSAYPNPSLDGRFTVETNSDQLKHIMIIDALGRVVLQTDISDPTLYLDLHEQPAGVYALTVTEGEQVRHTTIIFR